MVGMSALVPTAKTTKGTMSKQKKPRDKFRFYFDWMDPLMDLPNKEELKDE